MRQGEIVGIAGWTENGQTELSSCSRAQKKRIGQLFLGGKEMRHKNSKEFLKEGTAHIPEDRLLRD